MALKSTLYMFKSGKTESLHGFAGNPSGDRLPSQFAPWTGIGVVRPDQSPPHGLPRLAIEASVAKLGYQLWRKKKA